MGHQSTICSRNYPSCNNLQPPASKLPQQFCGFHAMSNELSEEANQMKGSAEKLSDVVLARSKY